MKSPVLVFCLLLTGACTGTPRASYDWKFSQIRADATEKDVAFKACEAIAKRRGNRILAANLRIWTYASTVETCMKNEGWQTEGKPVTISYV